MRGRKSSCGSAHVMSLRQENQGWMALRWKLLREGVPRQEACHTRPLDVVVTTRDFWVLQPYPFVFQS